MICVGVDGRDSQCMDGRDKTSVPYEGMGGRDSQCAVWLSFFSLH